MSRPLPERYKQVNEAMGARPIATHLRTVKLGSEPRRSTVQSRIVDGGCGLPTVAQHPEGGDSGSFRSRDAGTEEEDLLPNRATPRVGVRLFTAVATRAANDDALVSHDVPSGIEQRRRPAEAHGPARRPLHGFRSIADVRAGTS